jgi:glycosyltransferase involved in cell wall biosynthesis
MNLTIIVITYNEQFILPHFIKWYRDRFPDCKIVVYDNESTDGTKNICLSTPNLTYIPYYTGNKLSDSTYLKIKNNAWKHAETDWVLVCDADEFLDITPEDLNTNQTLFKAIGYNMFNLDNLEDITEVQYGLEAVQYDKILCFNKRYISEINYGAGCHQADPKGDVVLANYNPPLYHMKFMGVDMLVERYKTYASRLSDENKQMRWGYHYEQAEQEIRDSYHNWAKIVKKIR